jgi:DNA-binding LacI/PurR family transcriptional regulator
MIKYNKLKHEEIAENLQNFLFNQNFNNGDRLLPESQLAKQFAVNHLTIRKALTILENKGLVFRQQGRGTFFNGKPLLKPILYVGSTEEHIFGELFLKLQNRMSDINCSFSAITPSKSGNTYSLDTKYLKEHLKNSSAVIFKEEVFHIVSHELADYSGQVIVIGMFGVQTDIPCVQILFDRALAVEVAVNYLFSQGYRKISLFIHERKEDFFDDSGYLKQAFHSGFDIYYPSYISTLHKCGIGDWEQVIGLSSEPSAENISVLKGIIAKKKAEAFIADMDYRARQLFVTAMELGMSIPKDFNVVGIGDTPWATAMTPSMTSINLGLEEMVDLITRYSSGEKYPGQLTVRIQPKVVVRESTSKK